MSTVMRLVRIIGLHVGEGIQHRSKAVVYFLLSCTNTGILLLFWGAAASGSSSLSFPSLLSYYIRMLFVGALLMNYVEDSVSEYDIHRGDIAGYLLKPIPYAFVKFSQELPWRFMGGGFGLIILVVVSRLYPGFEITHSLVVFPFILLSFVLGFLVAFFTKLSIGLTAFWVTSVVGIKELAEVLAIVFAGFMMPLTLLPPLIQHIAWFMPFAAMTYIPTQLLSGTLHSSQISQMLLIQVIWLLISFLVSRFLLRKGLRMYGGVG